ncbi:MAG: aspartate--tRNA ligase [Candidatus Magasanikbacteria bacterium RIFOXYC2_FULL_40_16]|uniref:Aspartate--tRNA ligase n=3 Tax=Candidatus Magasanikiibacteriota TaxID=1752731 RepID=A0A1F6NHJ3_9BACT|nr:MAG: aspartate--tRNA ligase [Candidatus Magasanikbacteria bacterium RIFOXYA2_FULL_40_20]OGH83240.1 MAG: aspartate--tRNA ligase [Candidatus Magasanikbacteria bacterium RIFOXYB1_FULL_40_15]OGH86468.1 MAG: aspartate--tRNA ligase [Candidatus Magasanikbacteria bacterium RIFOXYB2_FULL_40_13]OGH87063.1 MAG: aspartate--tRNA ligase [Candidatus Magasanikbacteria bacterium RIFOXYA1_FULL_40_8]OGH89523.1 MAG: aspartate--tRNA ligase [Candidatus Magasanikbacteria bacterium RIFOXYC2_FULL_40_16]
MYRTHTCGELTAKNKGEVTLSGWVHKRRDLGGVIFVDLRDRYGITQVVFHPDKVSNFSVVEGLKYEYIIKVTGKVVKRGKKSMNKELPTGEIEVMAKEIEVLSQAKPMPFEIFDAHKQEEDEDLRLKYRFLEIRREKLKNTLLFRARMLKVIRDFMDSHNFVELATPILTVSSPEGARDFLVPSRLHPGKFYALPQAPQQYKQLLMVGGMDRYYQIAPCMRDEDPRADRSPGEFYQLDTETSFLTSDEFFELMEPLFVELTEFAGKKIKEQPFPRVPYKEIMETYGSDRPDLRYDLKIKDASEWAKQTGFKVFNEAKFVRALTIPDGAKFTRKEIDDEFTDVAKRAHAKGLAWMKFVEGKFDGTIVKFFSEQELKSLQGLLSPEEGSIVFFSAGDWSVSCTSLGAVRSLAAKKLNLADKDLIAWAWVVDFPMYEKREENGEISTKGGPASGWDFGHNPFSMPKGGKEALDGKDPLEILADQYDIIANGLEISSGAVRNKDPEIMYKAFKIAGYDKKAVDAKFGHMIKAFEYGAPPHCGFAPGIERLVMLLTNEDNIRNVVPFPKNQKAEEPMMGSPSDVSIEQLKELSIKLDL